MIVDCCLVEVPEVRLQIDARSPIFKPHIVAARISWSTRSALLERETDSRAPPLREPTVRAPWWGDLAPAHESGCRRIHRRLEWNDPDVDGFSHSPRMDSDCICAMRIQPQKYMDTAPRTNKSKAVRYSLPTQSLQSPDRSDAPSEAATMMDCVVLAKFPGRSGQRKR